MAEYEARKVILKDQLGRYVVPWTGAVTSINGELPDSSGNLILDTGVISVNGHTGAVAADQLGCLLLSGGTVTGQITASGGVVGNLSGLATQATQDSAGQQINSTYIKNATVSGRVITFTRGNGTTFTITTQDTATTNTSNWSVSNGTNGWVRDNSTGFTIVWGIANVNPGRYPTITYSRTLNTVRAIMLTKGSYVAAFAVNIESYTTTSMVIRGYDLNSDMPIHYIVIGFS